MSNDDTRRCCFDFLYQFEMARHQTPSLEVSLCKTKWFPSQLNIFVINEPWLITFLNCFNRNNQISMHCLLNSGCGWTDVCLLIHYINTQFIQEHLSLPLSFCLSLLLRKGSLPLEFITWPIFGFHHLSFESKIDSDRKNCRCQLS